LTKKKRSYELSINNLPAALQRLDLNPAEVEAVQQYKKQFPFLIEDGESVLVSLDQLWEALDTPYYSASGTIPELTGSVKSRSPRQEKQYRRNKFNQWLQDVALKECDGETFSRMIPTGKTKKKETFVTIEDAKCIAMLTPGEKGKVIRRYFVTVEKVAKQLYEYNYKRNLIQGKSSEVYRVKLASTNFERKDLAGNELVRFNSLLKKIAGARNVKETDLDDYHRIQQEVINAMKRGRSDKEILSFYIGEDAA